MDTRISSCCRLQTRFSSCESAILLPSLDMSNPAWARPGDYLKPGEDEIEGLKKRLDDRLAPPPESRQFNASHGVDNEWEIGDCLAQWWRPNFETFMVRPVLYSPHYPFTDTLDVAPWRTVPLHPSAHHETKRMQEVVPRADARA